MTPKLNILFLCGWYPSRVLTNNGDFIQRHAEAVNTLHNVSVLHIISDVNCAKKTEHTFEVIKGVNTYIAYIKATKNPLAKGFRYYKAFKEILKKIGSFDVIHLHEIFPFGLFSFLIKKPLLITEHWTGYHHPQVKKIATIQLFISRLITKRANYVCPVSLDLQKSMEKAGLHGNYNRVPNVVDTNLFFPKNKKNNSIFTILHVSNMLDEHKNVSGMLNTVSQLNFDFKLVLLGDNAAQYKELATTLNITDKIDFIDHIPHPEVVQHMQNADVFVLFSNYENLPCVILESFACGTPVITTDVGGISEFFPKEYGALISKGNQKQLASEIHRIKENPIDNTNEMHNYVVTNFNNTSIANQFNALYQKTIS